MCCRKFRLYLIVKHGNYLILYQLVDIFYFLISLKISQYDSYASQSFLNLFSAFTVMASNTFQAYNSEPFQ